MYWHYLSQPEEDKAFNLTLNEFSNNFNIQGINKHNIVIDLKLISTITLYIQDWVKQTLIFKNNALVDF